MLTIANTPAEHAKGVLDAIEREANAFKMDLWITNAPEEGLAPDALPSGCGTALCAAGWVAHNAGWTIYMNGDAVKDDEHRHVEDIALELLGDLDHENLGWLFHTNNVTAVNALLVLAEGGVPDYDECFRGGNV